MKNILLSLFTVIGLFVNIFAQETLPTSSTNINLCGNGTSNGWNWNLQTSNCGINRGSFSIGNGNHYIIINHTGADRLSFRVLNRTSSFASDVNSWIKVEHSTSNSGPWVTVWDSPTNPSNGTVYTINNLPSNSNYTRIIRVGSSSNGRIELENITLNLGCTNTFSFGSGNAPGPGLFVNLTTCAYAGDFSTLNNTVANTNYIATSNNSNDWITIRQGSSDGPAIAFGQTPLSWTSTVSGSYFVHVNTNNSCGTQNSCRTLAIQRPNTLCSGVPIAGTTTPSTQNVSTGSTTTISVTGFSTDSGITFQWQQSNSSSGPWSNVSGGSGATTSTYTTPAINNNIYYRCVVTCTNSGSSSNSTVAEVIRSYCSSGASSSADSYIARVRLNSIDQSSSNCVGYTDNTLTSTDLSLGESYDLIVNLGTCSGNYNNIIRTWIDWNGNGIFENDEIIGTSGSVAGNGGSYTVPVTVPETALTNTPLRMRVSSREGSLLPSSCESYSWGETEDYTIVAISPDYKVEWISMDIGSSDWCKEIEEEREVSVTLKNTGNKTWNSEYSTNIGVRWSTNGSNFSPWTDYHVRVSAGSLAPGQTGTFTLNIKPKNATAGPNYSTDLSDGLYYLVFDVVNEAQCWFGNNNNVCGPGNQTFVSNAIQIKSTCFPFCENGTYELESPHDTDNILWYDSNEPCSTPIAEGQIFEANLTETTTYYTNGFNNSDITNGSIVGNPLSSNFAEVGQMFDVGAPSGKDVIVTGLTVVKRVASQTIRIYYRPESYINYWEGQDQGGWITLIDEFSGSGASSTFEFSEPVVIPADCRYGFYVRADVDYTTNINTVSNSDILLYGGHGGRLSTTPFVMQAQRGFSGTVFYSSRPKTDKVPITYVKIDASDPGVLSGEQDICVGQSTIFSSSGDLGIWTSSNPSVASINNDGEIDGLSSGSSLITYTTSNGGFCEDNSSTRLVNVNGPNTEITVNNQIVQILEGDVVWHGSENNDWGNPLNWYYYNGNNYVIPNLAPSLNTNAFVVPSSVGGDCVGGNDNPIVTTTGSGIAKSLYIENTSLELKPNATLEVHGDFMNFGTFIAGSESEVIFNGSVIQSIGGNDSTTFYNLTLNNTLNDEYNLILEQDINVKNDLTLTNGILKLNQQIVNLGTTGNIIDENNDNYIFCECPNAYIRAVRTINDAGVEVDAGNIGLGITPGIDRPLGTLEIIRRHQRIENADGLLESISRVYEVKDILGSQIPNNGDLKATLKVKYLTHELNGITEQNLSIYRQPDLLVDTWFEYGGSVDLGEQKVIFENWNGFSGITLSEVNSPLPIKLTSFVSKCEGKIPVLKWTTESEQNSDYFQIERSRDGFEWIEVSKVQAYGYSNTTKEYKFYDLNSGSFEGYYRLKQVDFDGKFEIFSPIYSNCIEVKGTEYDIFPNPTKDEFFIGIRSDINEKVNVSITDFSGKIIKETSVEIKKGYTLEKFDLSQYPTGIYLITIISNNNKYIHKVIKK